MQCGIAGVEVRAPEGADGEENPVTSASLPSVVVANTLAACAVGLTAVHAAVVAERNLLWGLKMGLKLSRGCLAAVVGNFCEASGVVASGAGGALACLSGSVLFAEGNELYSRNSGAVFVEQGVRQVRAYGDVLSEPPESPPLCS